MSLKSLFLVVVIILASLVTITAARYKTSLAIREQEHVSSNIANTKRREHEENVNTFLCHYAGLCPSPTNPNHVHLVCPDTDSPFYIWNNKVCCKWTLPSSSDRWFYKLVYLLCPLAPFLSILVTIFALIVLVCSCILKILLLIISLISVILLLFIGIWAFRAQFSE